MLIIMYLHFDQIFACKELILMLIIMYLQFDHICCLFYIICLYVNKHKILKNDRIKRNGNTCTMYIVSTSVLS